MNILPLLMFGGAAAVVVAQTKKKGEKERLCPPTTVVTLGEMRSVADRSSTKYGSISDPSKEANHFINEILPPACNRSSANSRVKIQVQEIEKGFEMTIPDLYMLTFAQCLSLRVDNAVLATQEAEKLWSRELDWYKKVAGSNFDVARTGIVDLGKIILEVIKGSLSPRPDKTPPRMGGCPTQVNLDMVQSASVIQKLIDEEIALGSDDPFTMADASLAALFPQGCSGKDYGTAVSLTVEGEPISPPYDMAAFYGGIVWEIGKRLLELNVIGNNKLNVIKSKILSDYSKLTGNPFPQDLN